MNNFSMVKKDFGITKKWLLTMAPAKKAVGFLTPIENLSTAHKSP